jgi:8-oxo-dGTP pyrophosphatase MutT (NUDIX family)
MSWRPDITVAAVVERDHRFLIVEEHIDGHRVYNQPAGHVEPGESPLNAVIRETLEETAWQLTPTCLIGAYAWRKPGTTNDTLRIAFAGSVDKHDAARPLDHPVIATHWLTRSELLARASELRTALVLRCVDDYLAGQRLPLAAITDLRGLA